MNNQIEAIKAIRSLSVPKTPEVFVNDSGVQIIYKTSGIGLMEAKDLVEAIMALGVKCHLERDLTNKKEANHEM